MSTFSQLPPSAVRLYRRPTQVGLSGLCTPGQKATAKETWRVPGGDFMAFAQVVYGLPEAVGGFNGATIRRVTLRHPEYPALLATDMAATGVGWDPNSKAASHPNGFWKYMDCEVSFASPAYDTGGQNAYLSISRSDSTRQFPGQAFGFRLNGAAPTFDPGEEVAGEEVTATTHQLVTYPLAVYDSVRNCVNQATFDGRPPGTVLYRGPGSNQTTNLDGNQTWEVAHRFSYSKVPWNWYFVGGVQYEMKRADGSRKYELADLTAVFNA